MMPAKNARAGLGNIGRGITENVPFGTGVNTPAPNRICCFMRDPISFYNLSAGQSVIGLYIIYE